MDYEKIILDELNKWVYNDENQAGEKLQVIDASDFPKITEAIAESIITGRAVKSDCLITSNQIVTFNHD